MGASRGEFTKYPRTPHLFGSRGTSDDKQLNDIESKQLLADPSLVIEEKLDGTNVGIHFDAAGKMVLQCRGHLITEGMHPQYDLFKQWTAVKRDTLERMLADKYLLFGEWLYARHTVFYRQLPHYFFEFDIFDKEQGIFLDLAGRQKLLAGTGIVTVPVIHQGSISEGKLADLIGASLFASEFCHPETGITDNLMEGLYMRTEAGGRVTARAKFVRPEFVEKIKQSTHWQSQKMVPNLLADEVDIWS